MRYAANAVTVGRMALSLLLLTAEPLSGCFYGLYAAAGASDVLDGAIARRAGTASRLGAALDSAADLVFFCAVCCRLLPLLLRELPLAVWAAALLTAALRCAAWGTAFLRFRQFAPLHTWLNKAVGAGLFCLPWFWEWLTPYAESWRRWRWPRRRRSCTSPAAYRPCGPMTRGCFSGDAY